MDIGGGFCTNRSVLYFPGLGVLVASRILSFLDNSIMQGAGAAFHLYTFGKKIPKQRANVVVSILGIHRYAFAGSDTSSKPLAWPT